MQNAAVVKEDESILPTGLLDLRADPFPQSSVLLPARGCRTDLVRIDAMGHDDHFGGGHAARDQTVLHEGGGCPDLIHGCRGHFLGPDVGNVEELPWEVQNQPASHCLRQLQGPQVPNRDVRVDRRPRIPAVTSNDSVGPAAEALVGLVRGVQVLLEVLQIDQVAGVDDAQLHGRICGQALRNALVHHREGLHAAQRPLQPNLHCTVQHTILWNRARRPKATDQRPWCQQVVQ
mmetsp:Transcript_27346/g.69182  ORF Transcript_27346/g.69182 Transcript_27346/m.69182 type:complete len:233 (+) Transcript_27346:913-1611(+)